MGGVKAIGNEKTTDVSKSYSRPTGVQYPRADSHEARAADGPQTAEGRRMHKLWGGIDAKLDSAQFHLDNAFQALVPPKLTRRMAAIQSHGVTIGHEWQRPFFAHLDAFLSATKSVPEIIRACFGKDDDNREMRQWFEQLPGDEQIRRSQFSTELSSDLDRFRGMTLSKARNISDHRIGAAPIVGEIVGMFGTYTVSATERAPTSETRAVEPELGWLAKPRAIRPAWTDFYIGDEPLYEACKAYLEAAQDLRRRASEIEARIHSDKILTSPPA